MTDLALPPIVFPATVNGVVPHMAPLAELKRTTGGFAHPHDTVNMAPIVTHPP